MAEGCHQASSKPVDSSSKFRCRGQKRRKGAVDLANLPRLPEIEVDECDFLEQESRHFR